MIKVCFVAEAQHQAVVPDAAMNTLVAASIVSIAINPLLYRLVDRVEAWAERKPLLWRWLTSRAQERVPATPAAPVDAAHRMIVIGYGPVGRTLTRLLRENGIDTTIIEMDLDNVHRARAEGINAIYGDRPDIDIDTVIRFQDGTTQRIRCTLPVINLGTRNKTAEAAE